MSKAVWLTVWIAVLLFGCGQSKEQAIQELEKLNVTFTPDDFVRSAENGDMKAVQLFIDAGIDCNAQSSAGLTALMAASKKGRIDVVKKLLDQKVKIDAQGKDGVTALMLAADGNQLDIVNLLLKKNADPNVEDQRGWTALMNAVYQGNANCVEALAARSREEVNRGLLVAALMGHKDTAKVLLDHGAEVDSRAEDGRTPLMLAANKGDNDLVSLLLQAGADPTLTDKSGATAGSLATAKGYKELAGRLQQAPPRQLPVVLRKRIYRTEILPSPPAPYRTGMCSHNRSEREGSPMLKQGVAKANRRRQRIILPRQSKSPLSISSKSSCR